MNIYRYKAIDISGKILRGFLKAQNESNVIATLSLKNLYILSIVEIPKFLYPLLSFFQ